MKVSFVCNDTRGGVQPYLALGQRLACFGHDVQIVAPEGFRSAVAASGLRFSGIEGDVQAYMRRPEVLEAMERGLIATHRIMVRLMDETICMATRDCLSACEGTDLIVCGFGGMMAADSVADKLRVPLLQAHLQPLATTSAYPGLVAIRSLGWLGAANTLSHVMTRQAFWQPVRRAVNKARREVLGLPAVSFFGKIGQPHRPDAPVLYGYSPSLLPRPRDAARCVQVTGYWFQEKSADWNPPEKLQAFVESGPAPVAIGFGSMTSSNASATAELVLRAVQQVGCRVVLLSGWGGMEASKLPDSAYMVEDVPHDWLYARCAAVVHHGGAGTTGASTRAGVPAVIVPFAADQPFWAWLIEQRGIGVCAGSRRRLTAERLAAALKRVLSDTRIRDRAAEIGRQVQAEDGARTGAELIHRWCSSNR